MDKDKKKALDALMAGIKKEFGKESIGFLSGDEIVDIERFSTGSISLDVALGGGVPRGRIIEVFGPESSGKAQPLSSKVLTPAGWKRMGDLEVGSVICAPDGTNTTVLGVFPQGEKDIFKVIFDDKTFTYATADHLWEVYTRHTELSEVTTTADLLRRNPVSTNGCRKFRIPEVRPLQFNGTKELPLDPYLLGLLLGDGSFRSTTIKFSSIDQELIDKVDSICREKYDCRLSEKMGNCDYNIRTLETSRNTTKVYQIIEALGLAGKLSSEKSIPEPYLFAGIEQRTQLLQGLMDSDGTVGLNGTISFSTTSEKLSKQFEFLARSLGFRCTTSSRVTKYTSNTGNKVDGLPSYRSNILGNSSVAPVTLSRKVARLNQNLSSFRHRFIESIEPAGTEECQCIKVAHPDELYITDDFITTHNTTCCLHMVAEAQKAGGVAAFIDAEHALDVRYAENLGVNLEDLIFTQPSTGEEALNVLRMLVKSGAVDLIVVDSVAALVPENEIKGEIGDSHVGLQARMMGQALRVLTGDVQSNKCTVIFINQLRMKVGVMFGSPETTPGGNALKFYASQRIDIRRTGSIKTEGETAANTVRVKVVKNKVAPPFREAQLNIAFGKGIDKYVDLVRLALTHGLIEKKGAWYFKDGDSFAQGEAKAAVYYEENPGEAEELRQKILDIVFPPRGSEESSQEEEAIQEEE